jgi:hypothetical protein
MVQDWQEIRKQVERKSLNSSRVTSGKANLSPLRSFWSMNYGPCQVRKLRDRLSSLYQEIGEVIGSFISLNEFVKSAETIDDSNIFQIS